MLPGREVLETLTHYDFVVTYVRALLDRTAPTRTLPTALRVAK